MDFRDLKYFAMIADEGSIGRAAERVHRTQPALTKCIDRLEESFGTRLFEKDGRGIRLTQAGHILLKRTRQMTIMVEETTREMQEFGDGLQGSVRIGCAPTLAQHLMPAVFEQLVMEAPGVSINLFVGMNDALLERLRDGDLDLAVAQMRDSDGDFVCEQVAEDTLVVVAGEHHPVFESPCTLADLLHYRWMLPATTVASRQWLDQTFERNGLSRPQVQMESNVLNSILAVLEKTPLLSFATRHNLVAGSTRVREVPVVEAQMRRRLGLIYRRNAYLSPVASRVADILRVRGKDLLIV